MKNVKSQKMLSMFKIITLSKQFWVKDVAIACYLENMSYTSTLKTSTSFEIWFGHKPNISHLQTW
jgi:hypothetical protein